jgi:ATP-dependent Clp protease protease subunit
LLFQSSGGVVADGIALHNFFRALPFELTVYNAGSVQSMGTIAFLGARHRKASAVSSFQIHLVSGPPVAAKAAQLEGIAEGIRVDDARVEAILRKHLKLPNERWSELNVRDMTFTAEDGVKYGFADEIGEFTPPFGGKVSTSDIYASIRFRYRQVKIISEGPVLLGCLLFVLGNQLV